MVAVILSICEVHFEVWVNEHDSILKCNRCKAKKQSRDVLLRSGMQIYANVIFCGSSRSLLASLNMGGPSARISTPEGHNNRSGTRSSQEKVIPSKQRIWSMRASRWDDEDDYLSWGCLELSRLWKATVAYFLQPKLLEISEHFTKFYQCRPGSQQPTKAETWWLSHLKNRKIQKR